MRLATRALIAALVTLVLCAAVSAQTLRPENDPRNQSPTVGTGGPEGGPTGLFTIYDGSTLRRGEFTFSVAYSNFDRDPGNVDITDIPLSFNIGVNDYIELFFKSNGYRGIHVNNPRNLSSFYLPNSQLFFGATTLCTGPAIILAPTRVSGATIAGEVFRPAGPPCNIGGQGFTPFPFIGATGPNFGLTGNAIAPPFVSRLGTPTGETGNFSAASNFPGVGSIFGSILPGIVLTTTVRPATPTQLAITVPATFTIAPSYLPDAPFINRLYGESSFTNFVAGAKIRFTGPNNPLGVGIIPFYRWYPDNADDASGFNQLQRGAGPGTKLGDFGLIGFVDGRLSKRVNVSANLGFIRNSNPKSKAMGDAVLLDRPDEFLAGVGFDFPINKHVQPILELRSTHYVGGRTPNAFPNNPVDFIGGVKLYPSRWWGLGAAYRMHLNQQGDRIFGGSQTFPAGFAQSDDPHGFIGQFWIGHRNARAGEPTPNSPPTVAVSASSSTITLPCAEGTSPTCTPSASRSVDLTADARDPDNDTLLYTWSVTGGRLSGEGRNVTWDLSGVNPGTYTASVEVADGCCHTVPSSTTVTVAQCEGCTLGCPTISVSCPDSVDQGSNITFNASLSSGANVTYNWSVSAGTITSGQGTSSITVDTTNLGGQTVTATVDLGGLDPACSRTASCSTSVRSTIAQATKFDEYGNIRFNDEKARLDNYAIQLQNQPGAQGYIVAYGSCAGEAQARADRAKDYLVNTRQIDAGRLVTIDGGCRSDLTVELWIVPTGATPPAASTDNIISPCPACRTITAPRRRARRGRRDE
jgi:PKD domain-containing protein